MFGFSSAKGGVGVTVTAALTAAAARSLDGRGVLLVDLDGDLPAAVGAPAVPLGVSDWLSSTSEIDGLARLESVVGDGVSLLALGGRGPDGSSPSAGFADLDPERVAAFLDVLTAEPRRVVVDLGRAVADGGAPTLALMVAERCERTYLVTRACYLGLRRATATAGEIRRDGVVLVKENGRALRSEDVARVLDLPISAEIDLDPLIGRAVDAGLILQRPPRAAVRSVRRLL